MSVEQLKAYWNAIAGPVEAVDAYVERYLADEPAYEQANLRQQMYTTRDVIRNAKARSKALEKGDDDGHG